MPASDNPRPLPTGPIIRLIVSVLLILFLALRGSKLGMPVMAEIVLGLGLLMIAGEQVRRIRNARRPPVEERVSKHPLGLE
jgi:hypothetical protein